MDVAPLQLNELEPFAKAWYRKLDVHASLLELLPLMLDDGLELVFPEATEYGHKGFEHWYERVIRIFFDEVHTVKTVEFANGGTQVHVVVHWEASVWNPPDANSARISCVADQTWEVVRNAAGNPVVKKYIVNSITYDEGSAKL